MADPGRDRRSKLALQTALNGIDFVEIVDPAETRLRVHFQLDTPGAGALGLAIVDATITGGETIPTVAVKPFSTASWSTDGGLPVLELEVEAPGDFSTYTLTLIGKPAPAPSLLDPYFDHVTFSFKARCRTDVDCQTPAPSCPPLDDDRPPIDYLAKDFASFKQALSEFSALRYPSWQERSEADFGVMFMEALASVADDLSYLQDGIAAEGWLETATQRRSLVRLARLVDYEPGVALAARAMVRFTMADHWHGPVPSGVALVALAPDGTPVEFETGEGLGHDAPCDASADWNQMAPWWWDDRERCLRRGATEMWIVAPATPLWIDQHLLIETEPELDGDQPVREIVQVLSVDDPIQDPLYGQPVVRITWRDADALRADHDLACTIVAGNLAPAIQGRRHVERFVTSRAWGPTTGAPRAIVRTGANGTPQHLHTLSAAPLAWRAPDATDDPDARPLPQLRLVELSAGDVEWACKRSLLDPPLAPNRVVTVDPARYRLVDPELGFAEYDGPDGDTIRFGDGSFGALPAHDALFELTYLVGGGARGNVAADSITRVDPSDPLAPSVKAVSNPLAADGGRDAEPDDRVREMAPQAFRGRPLRAVRREDYEAAAESRPWVQRAGTTFRYTGSWLSVFTAVDPRSSETLAVDRAIELTELLDRRRLAGYESFVLAPRYAPIDLHVEVCARPDAFRADVKRALQIALDAGTHADGTVGFFHPDRFTFGIALERSALAAWIQDVDGVDGVVVLAYRRRGHTHDYVPMPDAVAVAPDEIIRLDNDPSRPDAGSLRIAVSGGK